MSTKIRTLGMVAALMLTPLALAWSTRTPVTVVANRLAGVWEISGMPNSSSGVPPFVNVTTIGADGGVVNIDPDVGSAAGESFRLQGNKFAVGFFGFLDMGTPARYEVQGTVKLEASDFFAGPFRTIVTDLSGTTLFTYEGTIEGSRLSAEPF